MFTTSATKLPDNLSNNLVSADDKITNSCPDGTPAELAETIASEKKEPPTIKVSVANQEIIYLESHNTLLMCLESADVEVHYHCRDGYCGACRVALKSGEINYPQGDPLAFVGEGEILPCCCVPVSDVTLEIE